MEINRLRSIIKEAVNAYDLKEIEATAENAAMEAKVAAAVAAHIQTGQTGSEKLLADIEARMAKSDADTKSVLEGLHAEIKEKAKELESWNTDNTD
jgi:hypothetical protein